MYSLTLTETKGFSPKPRPTDTTDSPSYISYMISRRGSATEKLIEIIRICRDYKVVSEFYAILQFIWEKYPSVAWDQYSDLGNRIPTSESPDDKVEEAYSHVNDPTIKRLFKGIDEHIYLSDLIWSNGNHRYDNYEY